MLFKLIKVNSILENNIKLKRCKYLKSLKKTINQTINQTKKSKIQKQI